MLRKWTTLASVAMMSGALVAGCGTKPASSSSSSSSPANTTSGSSSGSSSSGSASQMTMLIGTDPTFAPFEMTNNGKIEGFDIDLIKAIAKTENIKVKEIKKMQFTGLIPALQSDQVDVAVAGFTITKSRMQHVNFSNAYYKSGLSILVKKNSSIQGMKDIKTKVVGAKKGTTSVNLLSQDGVKDVKQYNTTSQLYDALESGSVSAVVFDNPSNLAFMQKHTNVHTVGPLLTGEYYGIAISKKRPNLLSKINAGLQKVQQDGEYKTIFQKYFPGTQNGMVTSVKKPADIATSN